MHNINAKATKEVYNYKFFKKFYNLVPTVASVAETVKVSKTLLAS